MADDQAYISWSGEFLVRRLEHPNESARDPDQKTHPPDAVKSDKEDKDKPPTEPRFYELIIDNDSGTYRPEKSLLPVLQQFLEKNLVGLQIVTMACDDKKLEKIKEEQVEVKKKEGEHMVIGQGSDASSISSSDVSELEDRAENVGTFQGKADKGIAAMEKPKETLAGLLPGKGTKTREKREEKADNAAAEQTAAR